MGYMTTFMVFNDAENNVENNKEQVGENVRLALNGVGMRPDNDREFAIGNHVNAMHALSPQHADVPQLLIAYQNNFVRFGHMSNLKQERNLEYRKSLLEIAKRVLKDEEAAIRQLEEEFKRN